MRFSLPLTLLRHADEVPPPISAGRVLTGFTPDLPLAVSLLAAAVLYLWGVRRLTRRGDGWNPWRTVAWLAGLGVVTAATMGGVAAYDEVLFSAHMVQHMLLAMIAPVLLALGAPITLALRTLPLGGRKLLLRALHSGVARVLTFPLLGLALFVINPFALYFTGWYPATLDHEWLHRMVHVHFLLSGCVFFWPLLGLDPLPHRPPHYLRVLMLFLTLPFHAFLGLALMTTRHLIAADHYLGLGRTWGASPLSDQHTGGGLLWASGDLVGSMLFLTVLVQWVAADRRLATQLDRKADRDDDADLAAYNARLAAMADKPSGTW